METYYDYKGYGIVYYAISGDTEIQENGFPIKEFWGLGRIEGSEKAEKYIDRMIL